MESTFTQKELERRKERIRHDAERRYGITVVDEEFREDENGDIEAVAGRWVAVEDDEGEGLFEGDEGVLLVSIVGAPEYNNERLCYAFKPDGLDTAVEVEPYVNVEPMDG